MKICLAQLQSIKGNVQTNIRNHIRLIKNAVEWNADLIVFPELKSRCCPVTTINVSNFLDLENVLIIF